MTTKLRNGRIVKSGAGLKKKFCAECPEMETLNTEHNPNNDENLTKLSKHLKDLEINYKNLQRNKKSYIKF